MGKNMKEAYEILKDKNESKRLFGWMKEVSKPFIGSIFIILVISVMSMVVSYASTIVGKFVVDDATNGEINLRNMLIMGTTTIVSILISVVSRISNDYINERFTFNLREKMYSNIMRSKWFDISQFHSEDIITRLTADIGSLASGLISFFPQLILTSLALLISFFILFHYDRSMALLALIVGPMGAIFFILFRKKYKKYQILLRESESKYRSFMQESIMNLVVMKTFMQEDNNEKELADLRNDRLSVLLKSSKLGATLSASMRIIYNIGYVAAFCWGSYRISKGMITYGTLTVFISLVSQIQGSISSLAGIVPQVYGMLISAKRICQITDTENEDYSGTSAVPNEVSVSVKNVVFAYREDIVLNNISFEINPGEKIGIIGTSGAGKTTLIRLLLSLVNPVSGEIKYTYKDGDEIACPNSRRFMSYVPQGNTLLSGTIRENLMIGNKDATDEMMFQALKLSDASKFIEKLSDGLDTVLAEKSGGISEGQAQRISIARALLADKPMLILDEATSALDETTESHVLKNISENLKDKTCFYITHRPSMLKYCDRIIKIDDDGNITVQNTDN